MSIITMVKNTPIIFTRVLFCLFLCFVPTQSAPQNALITQIPGFTGSLPSKHYSGYVTVDQSHGRNLFYYFVQSERKPQEDPVVLWLNGGPGCSSFDGFVYEHGPFNFEVAKENGGLPKLHLNPYSWSKVSNIIYLDSPAGVGFSYSKNETDYITGDLKTASDLHTFLLKWFELYPEFQSNPFFISGESYAGVYVPTLAYEVMKGSRVTQNIRRVLDLSQVFDAGVKLVLNLKGYLVGNGVTDEEFDRNALVPFAHGMGLISDDLFQVSTEIKDLQSLLTYQETTSACKENYYKPLSESCGNVLRKVDRTLVGLNIYNILEPCYSGKEDTTATNISLPSSFKQLRQTERPLAARKRMFGRSWPLRAKVRLGNVLTWPQLLGSNGVRCINDEVATSWLNSEAVRTAIHAEAESVTGRWELCAYIIKINYDRDAGSMITYHKNLTSKGYRALIFSGDHDMSVPYTGSQAWTRSMGYNITDEWRAWLSNGQVAGYTQGYANNLTFLTIKGAGHTVPESKPREALDFYSRFLEGLPQ